MQTIPFRMLLPRCSRCNVGSGSTGSIGAPRSWSAPADPRRDGRQSSWEIAEVDLFVFGEQHGAFENVDRSRTLPRQRPLGESFAAQTSDDLRSAVRACEREHIRQGALEFGR